MNARTFCILLVLLVHTAAQAAVTIRSYRTERDSLDYVFTALVSSSAENPKLSFNNRAGRTFFVRVGEPLGPYKVVDYEATAGGRVTLEDKDGKTYVLTKGKATPISGYRTRLVVLETGESATVRTGNEITLGGRKIKIEAVTAKTVKATEGGASIMLTPMAPEELANVKKRMQARAIAAQERAEAQARKEEAQQREEEKRQVWAAMNRAKIPQRTKTPAFTPSFQFSTTALYPIEWEVVSPPRFDKNGNLIPAVIIPTRFETRETGPFMQLDAKQQGTMGITINRGPRFINTRPQVILPPNQ